MGQYCLFALFWRVSNIQFEYDSPSGPFVAYWINGTCHTQCATHIRPDMQTPRPNCYTVCQEKR